ncbi:MAG: exodeoxyribonuclease VII small subunit [Armatimonadota bacterium]
MERPPEELSFEEALEELERLVAELEQGDASLEASLQMFEKGVMLSRRCLEILDDASGRIQKLLQGPDGTPVLQPADDEFGAG